MAEWKSRAHTGRTTTVSIVAVHYGLAEHGPTEPKETAMWAMRELRCVLDDIQAVKRAQPTSVQD